MTDAFLEEGTRLLWDIANHRPHRAWFLLGRSVVGMGYDIAAIVKRGRDAKTPKPFPRIFISYLGAPYDHVLKLREKTCPSGEKFSLYGLPHCDRGDVLQGEASATGTLIRAYDVSFQEFDAFCAKEATYPQLKVGLLNDELVEIINKRPQETPKKKPKSRKSGGSPPLRSGGGGSLDPPPGGEESEEEGGEDFPLQSFDLDATKAALSQVRTKKGIASGDEPLDLFG